MKSGTAFSVVASSQAVRLRLGKVVVLGHLPVGERSGRVGSGKSALPWDCRRVLGEMGGE